MLGSEWKNNLEIGIMTGKGGWSVFGGRDGRNGGVVGIRCCSYHPTSLGISSGWVHAGE